jgi:predicted PurR-regulated permease PerM
LDSLKSIAGTVGGVINWAALLFAIIIFSVYLLSEGEQLVQLGLLRISNDKKRERVKKLVNDVEYKLGKWMIGQTTVSTIAGVTLGISLSLLNVPFALPLGVLVGLLDTIPNIGTTLAIIPAVLVALIAGGWTKALVVLIIYLVYQQIENNLLIPRIMGNAVGLEPIVVMFGVTMFLILFGAWGAVLAVPIMVVLNILYEFFIDLQKLEAEGIV